MRRLYRITASLLRDWVRNREAVFFAVLFPVILLIIFSLVFGGGTTQFTVHVQNNDLAADGSPTNLSQTFVSALEEVDTLTVKHLEADRSATTLAESNQQVRRVLVIPDGFADRVRTRSGRVRLQVIADTLRRLPSNVSGENSSQIQTGLDRIERQQANISGTDPVSLQFFSTRGDDAAGAVTSIIHSVVTRFNQRAIGVTDPVATVETQRIGDAGVSAAGYYLPGFIGAIIVINALMTLPSVVAEYRADGTIKRLAATPLQKWEWLVANTIQQTILGVGLMFLLIAITWVFFGVRAVPGPVAVGLVIVASIAFSAIGLVVGNIVESSDSAISLGGAIAFPMMFLSGVFWSVDIMPESVQSVAELIPLYYFHQTMLGLLIKDSAPHLALTTAYLVGIAVLGLALATYLTDWTNMDNT